MKMWENLKRAYRNWLSRLGKSNQETFGGETPDCCKLNQSDKKR